MKEQITAGIRTGSAMLAGWLINFILTHLGVDLTEQLGMLDGAIQVILGIAYYVAIRALSRVKGLQWLETLLIIPKAPVYVTPGNEEKAVKFLKQNEL